jgi:hypothetical protein
LLLTQQLVSAVLPVLSVSYSVQESVHVYLHAEFGKSSHLQDVHPSL